jgi:sugar phosphate isomerase/epimerase
MRKWKLACMSSLAYSAMPPEKVVDSLARLGYEAVEWTLNHFTPRAHSDAERKHLVEVTLNAGLDVSAIVVQQDPISLDEAVRRDRIALCLECIEAAAECGVSTLNFFSGPAPWLPNAPVVGRDISMGAAWDMVYDAYDQFVKAAEAHHVYIAAEPCFGHLCHDFYTLVRLIEHYNSPYLWVNHDPSHDALAGNWDSGWIARQWGVNRIRHMHLKDGIGEPRTGWFLYTMFGEGHVDWTELFTALDDMGYARYCSLEYESFAYYDHVLHGDVEAAARLSRAQILELLKPVYGL